MERKGYKVEGTEIEADAWDLHSIMLVTYGAPDVIYFEEPALRFFENLNVEFSKKTHTLLRVGVALGIISAEQSADWQSRRDQYEQFVLAAYDKAIASGQSEIEARKSSKAAWNERNTETLVEPAVTEEDTQIEAQNDDVSTDYDAIDEFAISERAWALSQDRGFLTAANVLLTDVDEIEDYLIQVARETADQNKLPDQQKADQDEHSDPHKAEKKQEQYAKILAYYRRQRDYWQRRGDHVAADAIQNGEMAFEDEDTPQVIAQRAKYHARAYRYQMRIFALWKNFSGENIHR